MIAVTTLAAVLASIAVAPGLRGLVGAGLALCMLAIAVIDARQFIIPNELNAAGFALALVNAAVAAPGALTEALAIAVLRGVILALAFLAVRVAYRYWRGREGLGMGDIKLAGVAGAWLDWLTIPVAVQIAALAALLFFLLRSVAVGAEMRPTTRLPLGTFLAPAIWVCWLLEATVFAPL